MKKKYHVAHSKRLWIPSLMRLLLCKYLPYPKKHSVYPIQISSGTIYSSWSSVTASDSDCNKLMGDCTDDGVGLFLCDLGESAVNIVMIDGRLVEVVTCKDLEAAARYLAVKTSILNGMGVT